MIFCFWFGYNSVCITILLFIFNYRDFVLSITYICLCYYHNSHICIQSVLSFQLYFLCNDRFRIHSTVSRILIFFLMLLVL